MRTLIKFVVVGFLLLLPFAFYTPSASAAPAITVVNYNDGGVGSLRQAINDVDPGGTITFDPSLAGQTISLITGELSLAKSMTIDGGSGGIVINGCNASRVINITGGTITLNTLMIIGGRSSDGGGISNAGTLTCTSCSISGNSATNTGGGIFNAGTLTCTSCYIGGNSAAIAGGGLFNPNSYTMTLNSCTVNNNSANSQGGGVVNFGTFAASNCIFSGNSSHDLGGGLYNNSSAFTPNFCTFSNNTATNNGGGICIVGPTNLETCTLTGNQAAYGGGVFCSANSTFRNCTFKGNVSGGGSALNITAPTVAITNCTFDDNPGGWVISKGANTVNILNSIIWNNVLAVDNPAGTTVNSSFVQGGWTGIGGNNFMANPLLGSLADNGGAIQTMALLPGSPCIDAGFAPGAPATDARGVTRDPQVDIGAFESRGFNISIGGGYNQSAFVNTEFASPLQVLVASGYGEPVNGGLVTFIPPASGASAAITGSPATIASGSASVTVAANGTQGGPYSVAATAAGGSPVYFSLSNTVPSADLSITKSHTGSFTSGENASYTITATNNGPDTATTVTMADTLPTGTTFVSLVQVSGPTWTCSTPAVGAGGTVTGSIASLASGASVTFTLTVNVTAAPDTTLTNTVTISSSTADPTPGNNSSTSSGTVIAPPSADLSITKSHTGSIVSGENTSYTITATNTGPDTATSVSMSDTLPAGTTFVSLTSSPGWTCTTPAVGAGGTVTGSIASLASGASASFTLTVKVTAAPDTTLANTAAISSSTTDPSPGNNSSTSSGLVIAPQADLSITKSHTGSFISGGNASYTITATNSGPDTATSVSMTDTLPAGTTFVSLTQVSGPTWTCTFTPGGSSGTINGSIASLASGASASFTLTVNVTAAPDTTLANTVAISSATADPSSGNNTSTSSGTVIAPSADLSITKSHTGSFVSGENAAYTITATNSGPDTATSVSMTDTLPAGTTFVSFSQVSGPTWSFTVPTVGSSGTVNGSIASLASGASATFTLTVNVDAPAGTAISNTATVASTTSDPNDANESATDTATVLSPGSPGVTVDPLSLDVNETGADVSFTVCLDTYPTAIVTIPVSSSDTSEITVSPAILTFTSGNWSTPQTVTVSPVDDGLMDGNQTATIVLGPATSADTNYNALDPTDVSVTVRGPTSSGGGGGGAAPISPTVTTKSASPVSGNSAVLQGSIGSDGTAKVDKYGFMYGNQSGNLDKQAITGTSDHRGDFSFELTGLGPDQTYFFKAYTLNNNGQMISGNTLSFTTNKAVPPPVKHEFSDVPSTYWAYAAINQLVEKGYISGYGDGTFRPDANITRAEFITILVKALNLKTAAPIRTFTDTAGHWAKAEISTAAALGVSTGYKDGSFKPNAVITREEMAIMVLKAAKLAEASGETGFGDNDQISNWAKGSVLAAVNNQLMNGYPDNTFRPKGYTTRAEAVSVIVKLIK